MSHTSPTIDLDLAPWLINAFADMTAARVWRDGLPQPVAWSEIASWLSLTGQQLTFTELEFLRCMDVAWCNAVAKESHDIAQRERPVKND